MSERDDDILEFDFFDEPPTVEQQQGARVRMPRRRREGGPPRSPIRPPGGSFTPLLRLVGLIAFAILIVVLLVFWVQSCQSSSKRNAYRNYMQDVGQVAQASDAVGRDLQTALTTQGVKPAELVSSLRSLSQRQQQLIDKAQGLKPPGALRGENQAVVEALQFRRSGLEGLAATFRSLEGAKSDGDAAATLASQSQRFVASDVVWDDLFRDPSRSEMQDQGITGIQVPGSSFLDDPSLATPAAWSDGILPRIRGASTGGSAAGSGPHGSALEFVKALPSGDALSQDSENTIIASTDLKFSVGVKNSGDAQEVGIQVTLTIQKARNPIQKTQTIQVIDPGQTKTLVFTDFNLADALGTKATLKVDIAPVPQEENSKNNSGSYSVIFSLA